MKNLMFYVKFAILLAIIGWIARAWAVKPINPPQELMEESANVQMLHRGYCDWQKRQVLCMVGIDQLTETYWLLVFNDEGVLTHVVHNKNGKEETKWVHPLIGV